MITERQKEIFNDQNPSELISMGVQLEKSGQFEEAIMIFDLCLALNPWDALVINNKADCLLGLGKFKEAKEEELYALTLNPGLAIGWCTLAEIQAKFGERFCARLNLEQALKLTPKTAKSYAIIEQLIKELDEGKDLTVFHVV